MSLSTSAGLCRYCRRHMWRGRGEVGLLAVCSRVPGACDSCATWIDRHPGEDPRAARNTAAEQVPAERGETDPRWRHDPGRRCALVPLPPSAFEPDPDPDDEVDAEWLAEQGDARRRAARGLCSACPVRDACRAAALANGYDGLWGGALFSGPLWRDLVTGETGPTIYAPAPKREAVPA